VARAFASGKRPARSVVFAAWTAEEKGLLGAEYYVQRPLYPLARTAAVINLDPHVVLPAARNLELIGPGQTDLEALLVGAAREQGLRVDPEPSPEAGWYFRSDHFPFAQRGVPALAFRAGRDLKVGGVKGQGSRSSAQRCYNARCYHQPCDEFRNVSWTFAAGDRAGGRSPPIASGNGGFRLCRSTQRRSLLINGLGDRRAGRS
jgi:Zn-dependent M28 family amino/carboxypeptidase